DPGRPPPRVSLTVVSVESSTMGQVLASTESNVTEIEAAAASAFYSPPDRLKWAWDCVSVSFSQKADRVLVGRTLSVKSHAAQLLRDKMMISAPDSWAVHETLGRVAPVHVYNDF